jgi:hypothetical protein
MLLVIFMIIMILFIIYNFLMDYMGFSNINDFFNNVYRKSKKCTYFFNPIPKTFVEHEEDARQLGGHLVSIHNSDENEKIRKLARGNKVFIGGFRLQKGPLSTIYEPNYWSWCDHSKWSYTNWNEDWSSYSPSGGEPFIEMVENGKWNDVYNRYSSNIKRGAIYKINCDATRGTSYEIAQNFCKSRGCILAKIEDDLMLIKEHYSYDENTPVNQTKNQHNLGVSNIPVTQSESILQDSQLFNQYTPAYDNGNDFNEGNIPSLKYNGQNDAYPEISNKNNYKQIKQKERNNEISNKQEAYSSLHSSYLFDEPGRSELYKSGGFPVQKYRNPNININSNTPIITANSLELNEKFMYSIINDNQLITDNFMNNSENRHHYIKLGRKLMSEISQAKNVEMPYIDENSYELMGRSIGKIYSKKNVDNNNTNSLLHKVKSLLSFNNDTQSQNLGFAVPPPKNDMYNKFSDQYYG